MVSSSVYSNFLGCGSIDSIVGDRTDRGMDGCMDSCAACYGITKLLVASSTNIYNLNEQARHVVLLC